MIMLIYVSSAVKLFSETELLDLLDKARSNNGALDITGMLLYRDGNFMQLLEGPEQVVTSLVQKIKRDPRHRGFQTLLQQTKDTREFGDWQMGFRNLNIAPVDEAGYSDFLNTPLNSEEYHQTPSKALKLLLNFKKMMR
jgi:hypothetical protein